MLALGILAVRDVHRGVPGGRAPRARGGDQGEGRAFSIATCATRSAPRATARAGSRSASGRGSRRKDELSIGIGGPGQVEGDADQGCRERRPGRRREGGGRRLRPQLPAAAQAGGARAGKGAEAEAKRLKEAAVKRETKDRVEAQALADEIDNKTVVVRLKVGAEDKAFGSITNQDIAAALKAQHRVEIDRHKIDLKEPIKTLGEHEVVAQAAPRRGRPRQRDRHPGPLAGSSMATTIPLAPGRVPPHDLDAEMSVLGSILLDPLSVAKVLQFLHPEDFYRENNGQIYRAALDLFAAGEPIDNVTLAAQLQTMGLLDRVGGRAQLASMQGAVPTAANIEYYGRIVKEKAYKRRLISAGVEHRGLRLRRLGRGRGGDQPGAVTGVRRRRRPRPARADARCTTCSGRRWSGSRCRWRAGRGSSASRRDSTTWTG